MIDGEKMAAVLWSSCMLALLLLAGCRAPHPRTIAVIPQTTAEELWESAHAGVEKAALGTPWKIYWNGPSRADEIDRQIALVEAAIEQRDGGLILAPDHAVALSTVVRRAVAVGIPTVILDARLSIPPSIKLTYIQSDNQEMGRLAADRMREILHGNGAVAVLGLDPDMPGTVERARAFREELAASAPRIHILLEQPGGFKLGQSEQDSETLLDTQPGLNAIFTVNVNALRGSYIALKTLQKVSQVRLIGCGQDLDLLSYVRKGEIDSIVAENTYAMGLDALHAIEIESRGRSAVPPARIEPFLVTRENIDEPAVQQLLTMNWRPRR